MLILKRFHHVNGYTYTFCPTARQTPSPQEASYNRWREANPEDTLRFHALRLHEVGMIQSNPNKLITQGTDWRFLNELKKELKA